MYICMHVCMYVCMYVLSSHFSLIKILDLSCSLSVCLLFHTFSVACFVVVLQSSSSSSSYLYIPYMCVVLLSMCKNPPPVAYLPTYLPHLHERSDAFGEHLQLIPVVIIIIITIIIIIVIITYNTDRHTDSEMDVRASTHIPPSTYLPTYLPT